MRVTLRGPALRLGADLRHPDFLDRALRPGIQQAAVLVEGEAKANVHRVTGKLQRSLGIDIDGFGLAIEAHIGTQPGLGTPAAYTESETQRWKTPRSGVNRGDPQEYGVFEEYGTRYREGHPFLEPALMDNLDRIENALEDSWERALRTIGRR